MLNEEEVSGIVFMNVAQEDVRCEPSCSDSHCNCEDSCSCDDGTGSFNE